METFKLSNNQTNQLSLMNSLKQTDSPNPIIFIPKSDFEYLVLAANIENATHNRNNGHTILVQSILMNQYKKHQEKQEKQLKILINMHEHKKERKKMSKAKSKKKNRNQFRSYGCEWCQTIKSLTWRRGPSGPASLCNPCGLQWSKGKNIETAKERMRKSRGEWISTSK